MQKAKFFMEYLRVTQNSFVGSHLGSLALDFGGKDTGVDKLYCPCDMRVVRIRFNANGELYLESLEKVIFADGTSDYLRLLCIHDSQFNVSEGQILSQGEYFYDEGGMGSGVANKFSNHVHIEAGKGKWKSASQFQNGDGVFVIENQAAINELFILGRDVVVLDDGGLSWVAENEEVEDLSKKTFGVDISHHQTEDAAQKILENKKAEFFILRVAIGSESEDRNLKSNLEALKGKTNLGFYSANYFYNEEDAIKEADFLIDTIEKYGITASSVNLPIFCDWEGFSYEWNLKEGRDISPIEIQNLTKTYCDRIIKRGYKAGVYLNKDYWDNKYEMDYFIKNTDFYIWYARPNVDVPDRECYLWQYAADNGMDFGYDNNLDKNILFGEFIKNSTNKKSALKVIIEFLIALIFKGGEILSSG